MSTTTLLLQLIVILGVARGCGWLLRHLGRPQVVGEMAAGLVLGPAVTGFYLPLGRSWSTKTRSRGSRNG